MTTRAEKPALMSAPMIQALNAGRKSVTRRTTGLEDVPSDSKLMGYETKGVAFYALFGDGELGALVETTRVRCPYGGPGTRLWFREGIRRVLKSPPSPGTALSDEAKRDRAIYIADGAPAPITRWVWKNSALPGIHMPRYCCRHFGDLTSVTVERLMAITEADAIAEGIARDPSPSEITGLWRWRWPGGDTVYPSARDAYLQGWDTLNGSGSAARSPLVWRLAFTPVKA